MDDEEHTVGIKGQMGNIKEHIAGRAGITQRYLEYLIVADRDASGATAKKLYRATGIPKEIWVFGSKRQRQAAWKKFVNSARQEKATA